jgi:hypothetical protein
MSHDSGSALFSVNPAHPPAHAPRNKLGMNNPPGTAIPNASAIMTR